MMALELEARANLVGVAARLTAAYSQLSRVKPSPISTRNVDPESLR